MAEARCRFCGAEFPSRPELRRHYIELHRIDRSGEVEPGDAEQRPETETDRDMDPNTDSDGSSKPGGTQEGDLPGAGGTA